MAKIVTFGKNHEWQFAHISQDGHFVLVNALKELYLLKWDFGASEFNLGNRIILPKAISYGYSEFDRVYLFDKAGDIYSESFEKLGHAIESSENRDEIAKDLTLETSEFCAFTSMATGKLYGRDLVAISDLYYKIRLFERKDYHRMLMTTSLRTRFAENLFFYKQRRLLVYYDDSKMQLLDETEILQSTNIDTNYMSHPFVGHLDIKNTDNDNHVLVHALDTNELHLCELKEPDLRLMSLSKKDLKGKDLAHTEVYLNDSKAYVVNVSSHDVETCPEFTEGRGSSKDLLCENIHIDYEKHIIH